MSKDYQCVLAAGIWHATQEQANPPLLQRGGASTMCTMWLSFKPGYDRRRPTCPECLRHCTRDENRLRQLSAAEMREIVDLAADFSVYELSQHFGLSMTRISAILEEDDDEVH